MINNKWKFGITFLQGILFLPTSIYFFNYNILNKQKGKNMSNVSVMNEEFHDWLDKCPVQWFRIKNGKHYNDNDTSYYEGASYMFLKDDEEDDE